MTIWQIRKRHKKDKIKICTWNTKTTEETGEVEIELAINTKLICQHYRK